MKIRLPSSEVSASDVPPARAVSAWNAATYPPTVEYINSVWGEISKYGTKTMPDGRVWVIHGLTNTPIERPAAVPASSDGKGNIIYLKPGEKIRAGLDNVFPSVWLNPTRQTRGGV